MEFECNKNIIELVVDHTFEKLSTKGQFINYVTQLVKIMGKHLII